MKRMPGPDADDGVSTVSPRQANYYAYTLPEGFADIRGAPLYQVVALWGWSLKRPFCREEVASAFGISLLRAGDVMSYIRRARPDVVKSRQYHERLAGGVRRRFLHILAEPALEGQPVKAPPVTTGAEAALQALRHWFLTRPNPD
ncbi:CaiF/GrlA family transcriptional regulator [Serratia nevei]|uniref:CaiF/GrlA family transcriptional regulator n=1 Tax=Serratia nevei TaxID=2703794 RepID=UPI00313B3DBB